MSLKVRDVMVNRMHCMASGRKKKSSLHVMLLATKTDHYDFQHTKHTQKDNNYISQTECGNNKSACLVK